MKEYITGLYQLTNGNIIRITNDKGYKLNYIIDLGSDNSMFLMPKSVINEILGDIKLIDTIKKDD